MIIDKFDYDNYEYDDVFHMYYDSEQNVFYYDGGFIAYDIYAVMTPNEVFLFKHNKEDMIIRTVSGDIYEITYEYAYSDEEC
jgi:hypothetical protein